MNNIKFNYLYRDGSNYKSWGEVIFLNPENLAVNEVEVKLLNAFLPDNNLPPIKFLFQKSFCSQMGSLQNTTIAFMNLIAWKFAKKILLMF